MAVRHLRLARLLTHPRFASPNAIKATEEGSGTEENWKLSMTTEYKVDMAPELA